jgi:hypothetical protein
LFIFKALLEAQDRIAKKVPGFRFNLGFSGRFYRTGSEEENAGDEALIGQLNANQNIAYYNDNIKYMDQND